MERKRRFTGVTARLVRWFTIGFALFYLLYLGGLMERVGIHIYTVSMTAAMLAFILLFTFINIPAHKDAPRNRIPWYDALLIVFSLVSVLYIAIKAEELAVGVGKVSLLQQILCLITVAMILEAVRRAVSPILSVLGGLFFIYPMFGDKAPGFLEVPSWGLERIAAVQYLSRVGIFGSTLTLVATIIIAFIIFGSFLQASGAGKVFINLALAVAGPFRGGPAKVAIIGSSLFGMINGSALANVATTGTITIPLMKSVGYKPVFAGAVEAVASTGGPMTPPVMGASIFIMMDFLGVSYVKLMLVAAIPAFLYYLGLFIMVDHEAVLNGLKGIPRDQVPPLKKALADSWFCIVPIIVIVYLLVFLHYSPGTAAIAATVSIVLTSMFKKGYRMGTRKIADALAGTSSGLPEVGTAIAVAGLLMGSFNITGVGHTISQEMVTLAGGNLAFLVIMVAIACLIFGMGISGVAVYILGAIFMAPALVLMGVSQVAAHFFVLWLAHAALITPPVCVAAYLAGSIAGAPLMATGWQACRLGIVVYLMSVIWVFDPGLLLVGTPGHIAMSVATAIAGVYLVSCGVAGRMFRPAGWVERVLLLAGGVLVVVPKPYFSLIGLGVAAVVVLWQVAKARAGAATTVKAT